MERSGIKQLQSRPEYKKQTAGLSLVFRGLLLLLIPAVLQVILVMNLSSLWSDSHADGRRAMEMAVKLYEKGGRLDDVSSYIKESTPLRQAHSYLIGAVGLNLVAAVIVSSLFVLGIARRLTMINDNVLRFSDGKSLRPPLGGNDEIARLDAVFHDMTVSLRKAQSQILESEERLRKLIETLPIGVLVLKEDGTVSMANQNAKEIFLRADKELLGKNIDQFLPGIDIKHGAVGEGMVSMELNAIAGDGKSSIPVEANLCAWQTGTAEGEPAQMLVTLQDIRARREVENMKQEFVAMVTHDLRSPLTSIQLFNDMLKQQAFGPLPEQTQQPLDAAQRSVTRLLSLVNNLLDVEKLTAGQMIFSPKPTRVSTIVDRSVEAISDLAKHNRVSIKTETAQSPVELIADEDRLVQVLVNLLSNAIKYSSADSEVEIACAQIGGSVVEISVIDHGRGIPAELQQAIFDKYRQVDPRDARDRSGTGLGLPICKGIIEQHKGQLGVESALGKGSRFWFRIPVQ